MRCIALLLLGLHRTAVTTTVGLRRQTLLCNFNSTAVV